jgi:hypothetical protein
VTKLAKREGNGRGEKRKVLLRPKCLQLTQMQKMEDTRREYAHRGNRIVDDHLAVIGHSRISQNCQDPVICN